MSDKKFMSSDKIPLAPAQASSAPLSSDVKAKIQSVIPAVPGAGRASATPPNVYPHAENKVTAVARDDFKIDFEPNLLDNYDTYTYHWKLFITPLKNAYDGTVLEKSSQTIIAESGVTDITIDKVELNGIAVPSVEAGTGTQTTIKFEIVEPAGAGLLDKMYYEAVSLGIGNWFVMPCYLQLEFRGRDPITGESLTDGMPGNLSGQKWVWPIKLTNAKANVTMVGTRYDFEAILYNELAQKNAYFVLQQNVVLRDLTTLESAMNELADKLNADQYEKLIDNYSIPDTYKIIVDPVIATKNIVPPDIQSCSYRAGDSIDLGTKTASFNAGTGIDKVIDSICGTMEYFQKKLQNSDTPSSKPNTANQATDQMKSMWRIVTETRPIGFDMLRQTNAVEMIIYLVEYDLGVTDANPAQAGGTVDTLPAAKKRVSEYINKKILKKRYNYIFTGLNDQIISLDLNMNFSFAAAMARFGGAYSDGAAQDSGLKNQEHIENNKKVTDELRKTLRFINDSPPVGQTDAKIKETSDLIQRAGIDSTLKKRYTEILRHAKPLDRRVHANNIQVLGGIETNGDYNKSRIEATSLAQPNVTTGLKFISDVNVTSSNAKSAAETAKASYKGKLRPTAFQETSAEKNFTGIDPSSDAGRARTSSIFSTALYSSLDASLTSIKFTIKGDPFWLFPGSINSTTTKIPSFKAEVGNEINSIKKGRVSKTSTVNFHSTDNFIVLRFRTPRIYDIESTDQYQEVETFSGIYRVITVVSKFEMGRFVQELNCQLDPMINLSDFPSLLAEIEVAHGATPVVTHPPGTKTKILPVTAIKTDKITSKINEVKGKAAVVAEQTSSSTLQSIGKTVSSAVTNLPYTNLAALPLLVIPKIISTITDTKPK